MWFTSFLAVRKARPGRSLPVQRRRTSRSHPAAPPRSFLPCLEVLDDRIVPGVLTVKSNFDDGTSSTLRAVLAKAAPGDTINFNLPSTNMTIKLTQGDLVINKNVSILGSGVTLDGNGAHRVFEVTNGAWAVLDSLRIMDGLACYGGGIYNSANLLLNNCSIESNTVGPNWEAAAYIAEGGGIYNCGNLALTNCNLSSNDAIVSDNDPHYSYVKAEGGAICNNGWLWLAGCTLHDNYSSYDGGGIYNATAWNQGGDLAMSNCTIAWNYARGCGGGIADDGVLFSTNCTIAQNTAFYRGGGIVLGVSPNAALLANTIIAQNNAGLDRDVWGSVQSYGCNLISDPQGASGFKKSGVGPDADWVVTDAKLGPLGPHGGPTLTMALLPGSPAIGNGAMALAQYLGLDLKLHQLTTDQRGFPRSYKGSVDIGAYQTQGSPDTSANAQLLKSQSITPHGQPSSFLNSARLGSALSSNQLVAAGTAGVPSGSTINVAGTSASTARTAISDAVFARWASQPGSGQPSQQGRSLSGTQERDKPTWFDDVFAGLASGQLFQTGRPGS